MNKKTGKTLPTQNEIDDVIKQITPLEGLMCLRFADTLIRYVEITQKRSPVHRLQAHVLHVLVLVPLGGIVYTLVLLGTGGVQRGELGLSKAALSTFVSRLPLISMCWRRDVNSKDEV